MTRLLPTLLLVLCASLLMVRAAHADGAETRYTAQDTLDAISETSTDLDVPYWWLLSVVSCETGGTLDPHSVGDRGHSVGAVQLNDRGLLNHFYKQGYDNPFNPYSSVFYLGRAAKGEWRGEGIGWSAWSCARRIGVW